MQRSDPYWAVQFCAEYFGYSPDLVGFMSSKAGSDALFALWQDIRYQIYETGLYLLREECYRSFHPVAESDRCPEFFEGLNLESDLILDYGGGTGEYARRDWYDKGGSADFFEVSTMANEYRLAKFTGFGNLEDVVNVRPGKYDAIICMDVLEHLINPIEVTHEIYDGLRSGGQLLVKFATGLGIAGHLEESIALAPEWLDYVRAHFGLVKEFGGVFWLIKR